MLEGIEERLKFIKEGLEAKGYTSEQIEDLMVLIQKGFYMLTKPSAFSQGYKAGETWESLLTCPYERDTPEFKQWVSGHQVGRAGKF